MPIRPELRHFYGKEWKTVTRPRILKRAGDKCETCRVPNGVVIVRHKEYPGWWFTLDGEAHRPNGKRVTKVRGSEMPEPHPVRIILCLAHLNHKPGDDRDENLKALCQRCHFLHDKGHHRYTRATRKDAARPLLALAEARP